MHIHKNIIAVRRQVWQISQLGWSQSRISRYFGYNQSTISRWISRYPTLQSFKPMPLSAHPRQTSLELEEKVIQLRKTEGWCHQKIVLYLRAKSINITNTTAYRILKRNFLIRAKKRYQRSARQLPAVFRPQEAGKLVLLDTKHLLSRSRPRRYQYVFVDSATRYPVCVVSEKLSMRSASAALLSAMNRFPFKVSMIQTDNGPEFQSDFVTSCHSLGLLHRYARIRKPRDNSIVERFIRTIDEELWRKVPLESSVRTLNRSLKTYTDRFINQRPHLGLQGLTPAQKLAQILTKTYA
jgi:transposase InsO family protein